MMQVESGEEIRFAEFENGCKAIGCDDAASWKQALPRLQNEVKSDSKFKEVYKAAFGFNLETGKKNLPIEIACMLWDLFIPPSKCGFINDWKEFLQDKEKKGEMIVVTRDNWDLFFELNKQTGGNLANFEDDGGWPTTFDDFIEYMENKK